MRRLVMFLSVLCLVFFANCSYSCFHARRSSADPRDTTPKAYLVEAIDSITPAAFDTNVAPMSRIKIFFKNKTQTVRLVPGKTFFAVTTVTEHSENVACIAKCSKGSFSLVPARPFYNGINYHVSIANLGCGDTLLSGMINLTFRVSNR